METQSQPRQTTSVSATGRSVEPDEDSDVVRLRRMVRRQQALARNPHEDLVWQPRFAYSSAAVILVALVVIALPLWIVLYQISGTGGAGPKVSELVGLSMMLLGGFLTAAATWTIIIEMRGRVRMVDTLARTSEREVLATSTAIVDEPYPAVTAAPHPAEAADPNQLTLPLDGEAPPLEEDVTVRMPAVTEPPPAPIPVPAPANPPASVAATLEASSHLLSSFSSVLRAFGQLPAQVAMLAVALALFVGATVLSLH